MSGVFRVGMKIGFVRNGQVFLDADFQRQLLELDGSRETVATDGELDSFAPAPAFAPVTQVSDVTPVSMQMVEADIEPVAALTYTNEGLFPV